MKEAIVSKGLVTKIIDRPVPQPAAGQVLIKIAVTGTNPKDWKRADGGTADGNQGDDMAGTVAQVGAGVAEFAVGDRVAAFHEMGTPDGSYAEYGLAWAHTTFRLPDTVSFEEAATLPLAYLTAVFALYKELRLPDPWHARPDDAPAMPLVIYGASMAIGAFAVQLARQSNVHPIICVAGSSSAFVRATLGDEGMQRYGDAIVDYRGGEQAVLDGIADALAKAAPLYPGQTPLVPKLAFDAATYERGYVTLSKLLTGSDGTRLATVAPIWDYHELAARPSPLAHHGKTFVGDAHTSLLATTPQQQTADRALAHVYVRYLTRALQDGLIKAHPHEIVPGGLGGIQTALQSLKDGKAHGVKYVLRISDTEA